MALSRQKSPWKKGNFVTYRAVVTFHIGDSNREIKISDGDTVEYDGFTLVYGPDEYHNTRIRGAVSREWLVTENSETVSYSPKQADIKYTPADTTADQDKSRDTQAVTSMPIHQSEDESVQLRPLSASEEDAEPAVSADDAPAVTVSGRKIAPAKSHVNASSRVDIDRAIKRTNASIEAKPTSKTASEDGPGAIEFDEVQELNHILSEDAPAINLNESKVVRTSVGVDWDLSPHWRTRAKTATDRFGSSKEILNAICEVEQDGVVDVIQGFIEENF